MSEILCVIDGMTDPAFCAENYPALASFPRREMVRTVPPGCPAESLTCILTLLGVADIPTYLRGYVEALGAGIAVNADDLLLRASWLTLENGRGARLAAAPATLAQDSEAAYYCLGGYQGLLVLPRLAAEVEHIRTAAFYSSASQTMAELRPSGNALLERIFDENCTDQRCLVPWGQSRLTVMPPFPQRAAVVCGTGIVRGIALLLAMELLAVEGATGDTDTDLAAKAEAALQAAEDFPFVLLHINGADEAAHRRDAAEKQRFLSEVDRLVLRRLLKSGHQLRVASDHGADPLSGRHLGGLQPLFKRG